MHSILYRMDPYLISKIFVAWLCIVYVALACLIYGFPTSLQNPFFQIGPNKDFKIIGICIDTYPKYCIIICYCFTNSIFRTLHANYLHPWIVNSVQDEKADKSSLIKKEVFFIVSISVLYHWTDWLMYMIIFLSQIDMLLIEVFADLGMSFATTSYYLRDIHQTITSDTFDIPYTPYTPFISRPDVDDMV